MKTGEQLCRERGMTAFSEADYQAAHLPVSVNCLDCNRPFATNSPDISIDDDGFWWCKLCTHPDTAFCNEQLRASIISALPETSEEEKKQLLDKILESKPGPDIFFDDVKKAMTQELRNIEEERDPLLVMRRRYLRELKKKGNDRKETDDK